MARGRRAYIEQLKKVSFDFFELTRKESVFIFGIAVLLFICGVVTPYPGLAMWFGFMLAGYSAIANDSIQTIGTFIASNSKRPWWLLWLFIGAIFVATVVYSWYIYSGDVSYQRLTAKGFSEAPQSFLYLQLAAPIVLLILTRLRMPVSTTFLLLNVFSTSSAAVYSVVLKSASGYVIAFVIAFVLWIIVHRFIRNVFRSTKDNPAGVGWVVAQWLTSGSLWAVWIMQDAANIAIFLPRQLHLNELIFFCAFIFLGLGLLFYLRGDRIQEVVSEKSEVADIKAATLIDLVYAAILFYFKEVSVVPMSTTWVFLGLLGGRELGMAFGARTRRKRRKNVARSLQIIQKDFTLALIGLVVSMGLAVAISPTMRAEFWNLLAR